MIASSAKAAGTPTLGAPAVSVRNLHVAWDTSLVLHGVTFDVPSGQTLAITGANGSGKSTLLRALLGNAPVTKGEVHLLGVSTTTGKPPWRRIGYVPQRISSGGAIHASCVEVVSSGLLGPRKWWLGPGDSARALEALGEVGLAHRAKDPVSILSGGQQQRVLIARALVRQPDLLIMDEPMAGIDQHSRERLAEVVARAKDAGTTVLVVLHELGELGPLLDRELHVSSGHISYDGPPHLEEPVDPAHRDGGHHMEVGP